MYQYDKRTHKHAKLKKRVIWTTILIVFVGVVYGLSRLKISPEQDIKNSAPLSRAYNSGQDKKQQFAKTEFTFTATSGWKEYAAQQGQLTPKYLFKDVSKSRILEVYIDNPPEQLGVNKVIVVDSVDGVLSHDVVSDNCTTFTDSSKKNPQTGIGIAKWQEIEFLCDMGNAARAVVGTISDDGKNMFSATTPTGRTYKVFITYTDNNINPDYNVLYDILGSLKFR